MMQLCVRTLNAVSSQARRSHSRFVLKRLNTLHIFNASTRLTAVVRGPLWTAVRCSSSPSSFSKAELPLSLAVSSPTISPEAAKIYRRIECCQSDLKTTFYVALEDRRTCYRDDVLVKQLRPPREAMKANLLELCAAASRPVDVISLNGLTVDTVRTLKEVWMACSSSQGVVQQSESTTSPSLVSSLLCFYSALLASALIQCDADVRLALDEMTQVDFVEPSAAVYESILNSLLLIATPRGAGVTPPDENNKTAEESCVVGRSAAGDLAGYYFGRAMRQRANEVSGPAVSDDLWSSLFAVAAVTQVAPKLMDLWWDQFLLFYSASNEAALSPLASLASTTVEEFDTKVGDSQPRQLPYDAVHAALTWSAANRDVERSLRYFHEANCRGLRLERRAVNIKSGGALTEPTADVNVQQLQLRLLAKLMVTAKVINMDGGLKQLVVQDLQRLIKPSVMQGAPWSVLNDIISGLTMPSAMQLIKLCSRSRVDGDGDVPFMIWASLLRRCAHNHHIDEAEGLFFFIRKRFTLTSSEKSELVEIILRMYATLSPPDYATALSVFTAHVLRCPPGEHKVPANKTLFNLLIRAADSRNAAMMTFLEGCAAGVGMDETTFESLLASNPFSTMSLLTRKLPYDYVSSALDAQLRIPNNVDAHAQREAALKLRGKPVYDSTGDAS